VIEHELERMLGDALQAEGWAAPAAGISIEPAARREHGDFATNLALQIQKQVGRPPREVAAALAARLEAADLPILDHVEIAGPGFLNVFLSPRWLHDVLRDVVAAGPRFGLGEELAGQIINLEFVSANPTGPLHAGGGRWVAVGDALANLLAARGAKVTREYYLNDAGKQLDIFGASLMARLRHEPLPEDGYQGEYLVELAERLRAELGEGVDEAQAREWGYRVVVDGLRDDLARIGVHFDTWFSERLLHERGEVTLVLDQLRADGQTYEADGAEWLRSEALGDQRDRVLVRSDGSTTYLANDLAYHRDKFARGATHLINIWGADHHGQVKSIQCGLTALGYAPGEPEILLGQLVKLVRGGEEVRMSKRAGDIVTLADILDVVDPDVARLTFLLQGIDTAQTFDLDVVTAQSMENPVYYVQYAHARVVSVLKRAEAAGINRVPIDAVDLGPLASERELEVLRVLAEYPAVVASAAELRAPHRITSWVRELAGRFHGFYADCRVITDDAAATQARLWLVDATRIGLANALAILGVSAPDHMERLPDDADAGEVAPGVGS
jgi:arginyl-tRNA synthetase